MKKQLKLQSNLFGGFKLSNANIKKILLDETTSVKYDFVYSVNYGNNDLKGKNVTKDEIISATNSVCIKYSVNEFKGQNEFRFTIDHDVWTILVDLDKYEII